MTNLFKHKKFIIIASVIVILVSAFAIIALMFKSAVVKTEMETNTINNDVYYSVSHKLTKGSDLMLQVMADKDSISDDLIKLNLIIQQENNQYYEINNLSSIIISKPEMEFTNNFVSYGEGNYSIPKTSITNESKKQYLHSDNYIYYTAIMSKDELETGLILDISYNIKGKGLYFNNSFNGFKQSLIIN